MISIVLLQFNQKCVITYNLKKNYLFNYFDYTLCRSMGILLPPVSQVTNTRINLTQHHRNRSLDSALQRIPEVNFLFLSTNLMFEIIFIDLNLIIFIVLIRWKSHHQMLSRRIFFAQTRFWEQQCALKSPRRLQPIQIIHQLLFVAKLA